MSESGSEGVSNLKSVETLFEGAVICHFLQVVEAADFALANPNVGYGLLAGALSQKLMHCFAILACVEFDSMEGYFLTGEQLLRLHAERAGRLRENHHWIIPDQLKNLDAGFLLIFEAVVVRRHNSL